MTFVMRLKGVAPPMRLSAATVGLVLLTAGTIVLSIYPDLDGTVQADAAVARSIILAILIGVVGATAVAIVLSHAWSLEQMEKLSGLIVEASPSGMVMTDGTGKIVMINTETERLFGYSREELIGEPVEILVPAAQRNRHAQMRDKTHATRPRQMAASRDLVGRRRDGSEFPVEVGLNPIRSREGLHVLAAIIDVSEHKRVDRLKDEFVATVSHELRSPLTSISGSLGLLLGNAAGQLPEPAAKLLAIALSNSQRLVRLLNDILDIEKMESGEVVFAVQRVEVGPLVDQAIEANRGFAESYDVRLRLEARPEADFVSADPDRLVQVVTNLLSNAIKFSSPGLEVVVAIEDANGCVRISVRDHGAGIPEAFKSRIFGKFAQADSSDTREKGGTGLGLSIAQQIVRRHGGTIDFADAPGGGTVFRVDLPRLEVPAPSLAALHGETEAGARNAERAA